MSYQFRISPQYPTQVNFIKVEETPKLTFLSNYFIDFLEKVAEFNPAPPVVARNAFILASLAWNAYAVSSSKGVIDNFPSISVKTTSVSSFLNQAILASWTKYYTDYLKYPITGLENVYANTVALFEKEGVKYVEQPFQVEQFMEAASRYLIDRDADGHKEAGVLIGTLPNQGLSIDINTPLSTLNDYDSWTAIGGQKYLLPEWGRVKGLIADNAFANIVSLTENMFFPSAQQKANETESVLNISQNLTDKQKMIAEFWKGGSSTVTPPGFFIFFALFTALDKNLGVDEECRLFKYLCASLFQASIVAWKVKRDKVQSRPIQNIKHLPAQTINNWTGEISSDIWKAYQNVTPQQANTPPHPDFISGHSTFSSAGATILSLFFGEASAASVSFPDAYLPLLSPVFQSNGGNCVTNVYDFLPNTSDIQQGVPSSCVTLSYTTWEEMAKEAGVSRVYGGIHLESSNQGGLYAGRQLALNIFNNL